LACAVMIATMIFGAAGAMAVLAGTILIAAGWRHFLGHGRTTVLQGIVHLVIFAAFLFLPAVFS
jgi:Ca2+/H+ antiporter